MSTGADVLAARALGADLAYLGTRFIATEEANASAEYKQMLIDSRGEDIVYTSLFSGISGNYLRGSVSRAGNGSRQAPGGRQVQDELRQRRCLRLQGLAGHLERRAKRQRHSQGRGRWRRWSTRWSAEYETVRGGLCFPGIGPGRAPLFSSIDAATLR